MGTTRSVILGTVVGALAIAAPAGAAAPADGKVATFGNARLDAKLRGDLARLVRQAGAREMIPVTIVLRDQVAQARLADASRGHSKAERRAAVTGELKRRASASQRNLVGLLNNERSRGNVGASIRPLWIVNVIAAQATPDVIRRVALRDDVAYVGWDRPMGEEVFPYEEATDVENSTENGNPLNGVNPECGVARMNGDDVWSTYDITGRDVVVGIIDTGACIAHPDLANQIWVNQDEIAGNNVDDDGNGYIDDRNGWNFENRNGNVADNNGHGTHTGGTVAGDGAGGTNTGMAPDAKLQILRFWNNFAGESIVWECTQYAVDNDADVITASIGWPHSQNPNRVMWRNSNEAAMAAGVVVVYAAGNEGGCCPPDNVRTPGDVPDMITCGATDCNDAIAGFSSRGPVTWQNIPPFSDWPYPPGKLKPTVSAPGVNTTSCRLSPCSGYTQLSGTSMATPHISGAVALILEANPNLDHWQVKQILKDTAVDLGTPGPDNNFGAGRVDALAAVEAALAKGTPGDADGDGDVDFDDLLEILSAWGPVPNCPPTIPADFDKDCDVDFDDLLVVLANWT